MTPGYQTVQSAHAIAEFAIKKPYSLIKWYEEGNYLISLAVKDLKELEELIATLEQRGIEYTAFFEPDVNEITAIVLSPSEEANKVTSTIPLANRKSGKKDKHNNV